jgi:hypothetical protein
MTDSDDDPPKETADRYRNPPVEHRFRKGVSGNPLGRPPKTPALVSTKIGGQPGIGFEDRIKSLAIKEGYRTITVREGDRVERIPIVQAIVRKLAVAAANGNVRAQQKFLDLLIGAEADRRVGTMEMLKAAFEYKQHCAEDLAERARTGATGPKPYPHPDDVIIDFKTGEVRFEGPASEEQHAAQEWLREKWPDFIQRLRQIDEELKSDPENSELRAEQKRLENYTDWLMKDSERRFQRDALRRRPEKSKNPKKH